MLSTVGFQHFCGNSDVFSALFDNLLMRRIYKMAAFERARVGICFAGRSIECGEINNGGNSKVDI